MYVARGAQVVEQAPAGALGGRQLASHQVERGGQPVELRAKARRSKPGLVVAVSDPLCGVGRLSHRGRHTPGHQPGHDQCGHQGDRHTHGQGQENSV